MTLGRAVITVVFLVIGFFAFIMVAKMSINNIKLFMIRNQFEKINSSSVAESRFLAKKSEVAHWGNSNLCDYYVGQFRASPLSKTEIEKAYESLIIPSFMGDKNSPLELEILFTDNEWFIDNPYYWYQWWQDNMNKFEVLPGETTYLVYAISDSHNPGWDLRCDN